MSPKQRRTEAGVPRFNRELSWIEFNKRVLDEGMRDDVPLLERLKFHAIAASNFNEFFMVRAAYVMGRALSGAGPSEPGGLSPSEELISIRSHVRTAMSAQYRYLDEILFPLLRREGVAFLRIDECTVGQRSWLREHFQKEIFPALTPLRIDEGKDFPFTRSLVLYLLVNLREKPDAVPAFAPKASVDDAGANSSESRVRALIPLPEGVGAFVALPDEVRHFSFLLMEEALAFNADLFFPGYEVMDHALFRVTRDADLGVDEERDEDFLEAMSEIIANRAVSRPVRLEVGPCDAASSTWLANRIGVNADDVYVNPLLGLKRFLEIAGSGTADFNRLKYPEWPPAEAPSAITDAESDEEVWNAIRARDILLHHPYESYESILRVLEAAANDPKVLSIKITLYRTSGDSPIIGALMRAAQNRKQVTAVVELKARFDEEKNIGWVHQLERSGVIVIFGIARLKIHAKAFLVVRREESGVRRYAHLATGNYNEKTARLYTDYSFLTSDEALTEDLTLFFNAITGYSKVQSLRELSFSPFTVKPTVLSLIRREISHAAKTRPGLIMAKMNSLADRDVIAELYRAAQAGVRILLNVRGICMLKPGIPGLSETITVVSVIDRYLEHSRVFYFENAGDPNVYLASADWMERNLEKRIELMFPIHAPDLKKRLIEDLGLFFKDNCRAHVLGSDGRYLRKEPVEGELRFRAQEEAYHLARLRDEETVPVEGRELNVRRKAPRDRT